MGCFFDFTMKYMYSVDKGGNVYVWKWVLDKTEGYEKRQAARKKRLAIMRGGSQQEEAKEIKE